MTAACVLKDEGPIRHITLNTPARHNCLDLEMVKALHKAFTTALHDETRLILLRGAGKNFSSGGDVATFLKEFDQGGADYARAIVGTLHDVMLEMLSLPVPILTGLQGLVTGGSFGLILCSDHVVMAEDAFIQPYYGKVGFGPDGGWTALLPNLIGPRWALSAQLFNQRFNAQEALNLNLIDRICAPDDIDALLEEQCKRLMTLDPMTLSSAKALIWHEGKRADVKAALDRETENFIQLYTRPETQAGMTKFMDSLGRQK
ncbi:MAG: enoyl-CoA hydratase/isomerase family protein [Sphingomonadales bacterium]